MDLTAKLNCSPFIVLRYGIEKHWNRFPGHMPLCFIMHPRLEPVLKCEKDELCELSFDRNSILCFRGVPIFFAPRDTNFSPYMVCFDGSKEAV